MKSIIKVTVCYVSAAKALATTINSALFLAFNGWLCCSRFQKQSWSTADVWVLAVFTIFKGHYNYNPMISSCFYFNILGQCRNSVACKRTNDMYKYGRTM